MDKVSDPVFRVMCEMWGVDSAVKALKRMSMTATTEQIMVARDKEAAAQERWSTIFKQETKEG